MVSPLLDRLTTSRFIGPLAVALALLVLAVTEMGLWELRSLDVKREASVNAQLSVGRLRRSLLFMESATRGYLMSGNTVYLEPFHKQAPVLATTLKAVEALSVDALESKQALLKLVDLTRQKQLFMQELIRLFQANDRLGAMELLQADVGLQMMTAISDLADEVISKEAASFSVASEVRESAAFVSRVLIWLLVAASFVGAMILMRLTRARERDHLGYMAQLRAERDLLDEQVTHRTAETVALALHMERVREDERGRLARELHDELGGLLTAAKLDVARIRKRLPEAGLGQDILRHLIQALDAGIAVKRRITEDLHPSSLANLGLRATLQIQCTEFAQHAEIRVTSDIADIDLPRDHALAVYRIVQEALNNVAKYAAATAVRVSMVAVGDRLEVRVVDDGKGFNPELAESAGGHGLQGMRFRVRAFGGELHLQSFFGKGSSVLATFPLQMPAQDSSEILTLLSPTQGGV